jgi:hypothetical protein
MRQVKQRIKPIALVAAGVGLVAIGTGVAYWQFSQSQRCVQFTSGGGQEVTFSRGCINPQRYKKWVITAQAAQPAHDRQQESRLISSTRGDIAGSVMVRPDRAAS